MLTSPSTAKRQPDPGVLSEAISPASSTSERGGANDPSCVAFHGILFDRPIDRREIAAWAEPACFADLHLDQVLDSMVAGREEYDLKPFFYAPLHDVAVVRYRHDALHDLEQPAVLDAVQSFAKRMADMRKHLGQAGKLHYKRQKERWFLDAVAIYCNGVAAFAQTLTPLALTSRAFQGLSAFLARYATSDAFTSLAAETKSLRADLDGVTYCIHIKGSRVTVSPFQGDADYSAEVEQTFAKFAQGDVDDHLVKFPSSPNMDHVEAQVLDFVAQLNPAVFARLDDFANGRRDYLDETIRAFDREVQFYLAYLDYMKRFTSAGLAFCYPAVSTESKRIFARDAFDLALANRLVPERATVVCNDFALDGPERIVVVTGPNQGGKTTFARMFGQLPYLASLGLPVPGREARLFLPDQVFTHFEREEDLANLRGKLEDELVRIHDILQQATSDSIVIMNETFGSTTLNDSLLLGTAVIKQLIARDLLCVFVTFVDELASLGASTVSMMSMVIPDNPATRTFKVVRQPANGLAYAAAIAEKYGLTYDTLRRRIAS